MTSPFRFRFIGDHANEHCGSAAVSDVIRATLGPHGIIVGPKDEFDVLVVNGEGSMHHDRPKFLQKMQEIRIAQITGKQTHLINTVWESNGNGYDDCLRRLDSFWVRGQASALDLRNRHGLDVGHLIDLSYFAAINEDAPVTKFSGQIVSTDVYSPNFGFVWLPASAARGWKNIDMRKFTWSALVRSLQTANLLIAGRHHGMYAACRARIPFIPIKGNSHKFEDLLETAKAEIPLAESLADATSLVKWALANKKAYIDLFNWMDSQPRWEFGVPVEVRPIAASSKTTNQLVARAKSLVAARNHAAAALIWKDLVEKEGGNLPSPRHACISLFGNGDVEVGMEVMARARLNKPESIIFPKDLMQFARLPTIWLQRDNRSTWWSVIKEAAHKAQVGDIDGYGRLTAQALDCARRDGGVMVASCASFFLAAKLVQFNLHTLAFALRKSFACNEVPRWSIDQEDVLLNALCRRFDAKSLELLSEIERHSSWSDPALRAVAVRHRSLFLGASDEMVMELQRHCRDFPDHPELNELLLSLAGEAGRFDIFESLPKKQLAVLPRAAMAHLPVARYLVEHGLTKSPALVKRAALLAAFESGREEFERLLADNTRRIAVVGNSPVEIGRGRGSVIDTYDVVVRFNDFVTHPPFDRDYGTRVDVNVQTYPIGSRPEPAPAELVRDALLVQRHAFNVFAPRDWTPVLRMADNGRRLAYIPRPGFITAARKLDATPSAGFVIANLMKQLRGRLNRADFFGFSFTDQVSGVKKAHYFNDERPSLIHEWEREVVEFDKLFE